MYPLTETAVKIVFSKQVLITEKEKKEKLINSQRLQQSVIFQMTPKEKLEIMCKQRHLRSQRLYVKKNSLSIHFQTTEVR